MKGSTNFLKEFHGERGGEFHGGRRGQYAEYSEDEEVENSME